MFQSFWKLFKSSLRKQKCLGEASLFNLHFLYFNYHPKFVQFMEDIAFITALNHSGSFGENFVMFKEKK